MGNELRQMVICLKIDHKRRHSKAVHGANRLVDPGGANTGNRKQM